ncbi:MAG: type II toxin-antitoxin system HicB family antitoxin [Ignavibacteriae bacterium]|nr:type II toxin-antitoxin system HicB family antitoxin [Ignavibacteriota bacterium]
MKSNKTLLASIQIEKNEDGFLATLPSIQGAFAEGDTIEEALFNCVDVVKLIVQYRKERGEDLGFNVFNFNKTSSMTVALPIGIN